MEIIDQTSLNKSAVTEQEVNKLMSDIQTTSDNSQQISKVATSSNSKPVDMMAYESIAMLVMFSILTAFELAHSIVRDKLNNTMFRIKSTPTANLQYVFGKVFGIVFAIVVQMLTVIIISRIAFGVKFGSIFEMLLVTLVYGFTIGMIVFCAGIAAKDHMAISSFAAPILWVFSFLGGSFINKNSFSAGLAVIQKIIPNGKAINCYLKICQGKGINDIYIDLLQLLAIGLVFLIIALILSGEGKLKIFKKSNKTTLIDSNTI
ncbi:ABC transporter permease [Clostridium sp.]|uniref:ABC transporter permease n=1 Tax=Clostridium sp. TaxID=1506 RepID=UPI002582E914|nr:ABC transporter permease [Clostridium sp.]